ncbi:MAG: hypothetical protein ABFD96_15060 [Armatimonadia bacterium]
MRFRLLVPLSLLLTIAALAAPKPDPKLCEEVDGAYDLSLTLPATGSAQSVVLDWRNGQGLVITFDKQKTTVQSVAPRATTTLASAGPCRGKAIRIRRRYPDLVILSGSTELLHTYSNRQLAGVAGPAAGARVGSVQVQPIEPVEFSADFFDPNGGAGQWQPLSGQWRIAEYRDPLVSIQDGPVGASWYECDVDGKAISLTGEDFWESYRPSVKVQALPEMAVGLVFNYRGPRQHQVLALKPVSDTEAEVAAGDTITWGSRTNARIACRAGNWYQLAVEPYLDPTKGLVLRGLVNGMPVVTLPPQELPAGKVGLFAAGKGQARFDDFLITPVQDVCDRGSGATIPHCWRASGGKWAYDSQRRLSGTGNGTLTREMSYSPDFVFSTVQIGSGLGGLVLNWTGQSGYRLAVNKQGTYSLTRVTNGTATTLLSGQCTGAVPLRLSHHDGRLEAQVGDKHEVIYDFAHTGGQCGVFVNGDTSFRSFTAGPVPDPLTRLSYVTGTPMPMPGENDDTRRFVLGYVWQPSGGNWTGIGYDDQKLLTATTYGQQPTSLWYHQACPGDAAIALDDPKANSGAAAGLALSCQRRDIMTGYRAELTGLILKLYRLNKLVGERTLPAAARELRLWRDGKYIAAAVGDHGLSYADDSPLTGSLCAAYASGGGFSVQQVTLSHRNASYYAFKAEETDWQPVSGEWMTHSGMACIPWDYWYTARGANGALAFNTRPQPADLHLDTWISEYSEGYANKEHKHFPYHDLSLITSAADTGPDSGYRFVIGGDGGEVTRLLRKGQVVAETRDRRFRIVMGGHCNTPREFHVVIHQESGRLTLELNGAMALDYTDPAPLPGGLVGLGAACHAANFRDLCIIRLRGDR